MTQQGFYPLNDSVKDPTVRGESPRGFVIYENIAFPAMVAGVATVDVSAPFGKGLGEVTGIQLLNTIAATNKALVASVALSATAGNVTVTINSTDAAAIDTLTLSFIVYGKIVPVS